MKSTFLISIFILCSLVSGCMVFRATPEKTDSLRPAEINSTVVASDRVVIDRISINQTVPPPEMWDRTIDKLRQYVSGEVVLNEMMSETIPADDNGYLSESRDISINEIGPNQITVLFIPKMKEYVRGTCWTGFNDDNQITSQVIRYNEHKIHKSAFLFLTKREVWEIVLLHEFGHALGVPSDPSRTWSDSHCTNPSCVMYPRPDFRSICAFLFHGYPTDFCAQCKVELQTAKNLANKIRISSDPSLRVVGD